MNYYQPFIPDTIYHVFNRAVGNDRLFLTDENYKFFLRRYDNYISPVADTIAYNLLPNHFHLIIQIKSESELSFQFHRKKPNKRQTDDWEHNFIMLQFSSLLNSYAKAFNNSFSRKGSLFIKSLKRIVIEDDIQLASTIFYVHKNAVHHGCCKRIIDWQWSSYKAYLSEHPTKIARDWVLEFFGNKLEFIKFHSQSIQLKHAVPIE